jgi:hypothetical protein
MYAPPTTREVHLCTGKAEVCITEQHSVDERSYDVDMAIDRNDLEERQIRLDAMMERFRDERQRRLVEIGKALWNRTEQGQRRMRRALIAPPTEH